MKCCQLMVLIGRLLVTAQASWCGPLRLGADVQARNLFGCCSRPTTPGLHHLAFFGGHDSRWAPLSRGPLMEQGVDLIAGSAIRVLLGCFALLLTYEDPTVPKAAVHAMWTEHIHLWVDFAAVLLVWVSV